MLAERLRRPVLRSPPPFSRQESQTQDPARGGKSRPLLTAMEAQSQTRQVPLPSPQGWIRV